MSDEGLYSRVTTLLQLHRGTTNELRYSIIHTERDTRPGKLSYYSLKEQRQRATHICNAYISRIIDPRGHVDRLDQAYSDFASCQFAASLDHKFAHVTERVVDLLSRLPSTPPILSTCWSNLTSHDLGGYMMPDAAKAWENLQIVQWMDTNTIRLALILELEGDGGFGNTSREFINRVYQLLAASSRIKLKSSRCLLVQAFLWTSWHRLTLVHYAYCLGMHLRNGYDHAINTNLDLDGIKNISDAAEKDSLHRKTFGYMCNWAFQTLRSDRASAIMDSSAFHNRFDQVKGHLRPRCVLGPIPSTCNIQEPGRCVRFTGQQIEDQSAHEHSCAQELSCWKLAWDEDSYRSQPKGSRAVSLQHTSDTRGSIIRYCPVSNTTMAVSHVWSHGQGGRPEQGFNLCLHRRYRSIAKSFGCDSYWMDAPCVPTDTHLRKEAIAHINDTFRLSKLTLVCDSDLMDIDISQPSTELFESILAVISVCDWNLRAWTLLEAMRGRSNIHILFKGEQTRCFKDILQQVYSHGSIAMATLFVTAQQLLPVSESVSTMRILRGEDTRRSKGFISAEEAASLLGHRHTSKPEDQIVIWSLLVEEKPCYNAHDFWSLYLAHSDVPQEKPLRRISTSFLMSSLPRMREEGFRWAPAQPSVGLEDLARTYLAPEFGRRGDHGELRDGILWARWSMMWFKVRWRKHRLTNWLFHEPEDCELNEISRKLLRGYRYGALLQPSSLDSSRYADAGTPFGEGNQSNSSTWFVVVGSNDPNNADTEGSWENGRRVVRWHEVRKWMWMGIHRWTNATTVPNLSNYLDWIPLV